VSRERELDAAGITDPVLRAAHLRCRELNARHGRTYYLAARLLTPAQRPAVHALYGFARMADDVLDADPGLGPAERERRLAEVESGLITGLAEGRSDHPVTAAVVHTTARYGIPHGYFQDFLESMRMDLRVTDYPDMAALSRYMRGSAEVIGLQMLPVLGTRVPLVEAEPSAAALGTAFQLTNFLRDVGEDLDRGRVYLPADLLNAHGVGRELLARSRVEGTTHPRIRAAVADLVGHTRGVYRTAEAGIPLLEARSRPCVRTALRLYRSILDLIERRDHDVLTHRAVVSRPRRLAVALPALARVAWSGAMAGRAAGSPGAGGTTGSAGLGGPGDRVEGGRRRESS
jgi:phytoene synthase